MKRLLLLLLGWAMIGHGMRYTKDGVRDKKHSNWLKASSARCSEHRGKLLEGLSAYQTYVYQSLLQEALELDDALKKLQPKDKITIAINNTDIPDCHHPNQITHTHVRSVESITDFVVCAQDCRIQMLPTLRDTIKISLITCATDQMCQKYFKRRGCMQKFDHQLYILLPQIDHRFVTCMIEHPIDQIFGMERMSFEVFMEKFEKEPVSSSDSSDLDLSSDEKEEKEL